MNASSTQRHPVEALAEEFLERFRRGERPSLTEYAEGYPELAGEIRDLFPALVMMEQAGPGKVDPLAICSGSVSPDGRPLERLGDYRILREIGRGGMGLVYEAVQESLGRHVALKVLPFQAATDPIRLTRFQREARAAANLHHTNIVPVFDVGEHRGVHYFAMQFIQGQSLDEVLVELRRMRGEDDTKSGMRRLDPVHQGLDSASHPLTVHLAAGLSTAQFGLDGCEPGKLNSATPSESNGTRAAIRERPDSDSAVRKNRSELSSPSDFHYYRSVARVGLQIAEALAYAHSQNVLHRDIKPANLLLDLQGIAWVTDFGLAKDADSDLTKTGDIVGTLHYMPPERFNGKSDARSDVYSLGLTLYELLTFRPAFSEFDRGRLIRQIMQEDPPRPRSFDRRIPRDLETIVLKAMAKEPGRRYATAKDLEEDLRRFLTDRPIHARRVTMPEQAWRWVRRNPGWAATVTAILGLLLVIAVGGTVLNFQLGQALNDKTEQLWQSHLQQARALRTSGRIGQRFEALKAIREAAKIRVTPELRSEATAALCLPDVEIAREWEGYTEDSVAWSSDAKFERYARLNNKGEVTVCRFANGGEEVTARLPAYGGPLVSSLWMSPNGRFIAYGHSCTREGIATGLRVWDLDGPVPRVLFDEPAGVHGLALSFHSDGRRLAVGHPNGTLSIYELQTGQRRQQFKIGQPPRNLAFHPRDGRLAAACGNQVRIFNIDTVQELGPLRHPEKVTEIEGLAWHPDGVLLATGCNDFKIHLWDTPKAVEAMTPLEVGLYGILVAFNHAGDRLASTVWGGYCQVWDPVAGQSLLRITGGGTHIPQFSQDDSLLGLDRNGTKLRLWRLADGREVRALPNIEPGTQTHLPVMHANGRVIALTAQHRLGFYDIESGKVLASIPLPGEGRIQTRSFDSVYGWLTCGPLGFVSWPTQSNPERPEVLHVGPPRWLASAVHHGGSISRDGRIIALPKGDHTLLLDRDRPGRRVILGPQPDVRSSAVSPDGNWVVTCTWHGDGRSPNTRVWDANTGNHVYDLPVDRANSTAQFSPDSRWLATLTFDDCTRLWEVGTWRERGRLGYSGCGFSPDGRMLASGEEPGVLRLIETASFREIGRVTLPALTSFWPVIVGDGTQLIAVSGQALHVVNVRLIREQLKELGLDWDWPEFPPIQSGDGPPSSHHPKVEVDPGYLRTPVFANDRHDVAAFSLLLAQQPVNPGAYFQRGLAFDRLKQRAEAAGDFGNFLSLAARNDHRRHEVQFRLAANYEGLGKYELAFAALKPVLGGPLDVLGDPAHVANVCNDAAWYFIKAPSNKRLPDEILILAQKAVELAPENFMHQNTLGIALYREGRHEEAARCLEANAKISRQYAAFDLYFLAMSCQRLGQPAKARDYHNQANASAKVQTALTPGHLQELAAFRTEAEAVLGLRQTK